MLLLYNILQLLFLLACWPLILMVAVTTGKYRHRFLGKLGWGLRRIIGPVVPGKKTIWIHALSVGEVTSALPLIRGIRQTMDVRLVFSVTTRTGAELAKEKIALHVDSIIPFSLDILPVVEHFVKMIRPDIFILVETDFWPNLLAALHRNKIPSLLVNGRISGKSMDSYRRFGWFFKPLFLSFSALCMQTASGRERMIALGVPENRVFSLGNLKFDTSLFQGDAPVPARQPEGIRIVAGSTHPGEEKDLFLVLARLRPHWKDVSLVVAPRHVSRGAEIRQLAENLGLTALCRTQQSDQQPELLILDTIGELAGYYQACDIAFVGGSLVNEGGHNPIEPAIAGVPVLFGPHMEDFAEIAAGLLAAGGAIQIQDADSLYHVVERLLSEAEYRRKTGLAALMYIKENQGVISRHLELVGKFL